MSGREARRGGARAPARRPAGAAASAPDMTFDGAVLARVPRQARSRDKVSRALAAAERLLARDGLGALTLTAVAREAGVSVGALHQYLPDREAIVRALLTRYHARFELLMTGLLAGPAVATDDPVGLVVDAFADLHRRSAGVRALGLDAAQRDVHTREHKARMAVMLEQLLRARGLLPDGDVDSGGEARPVSAVARTAFVAADALMHEAFRDDGDGDPQLLEELRRLLRVYLR